MGGVKIFPAGSNTRQEGWGIYFRKFLKKLLKTLTGDVCRRDVIFRPLNSIVSRVRELARDIRPSARMSEKRPAPSRWAFFNGINSLEFSKFFQKIPNVLTSITHKLLTYSGS